MPHRKTSLKCDKCGQPIYSDEGFTTRGIHHFHAESCTCILNPHQVKRYKPPKDLPSLFFIPSIERGIKKDSGFKYDQ